MDNNTNESFIDANSNGVYDSGETALWTQPLYFPASGSFRGVLGDVGGVGDFWLPVVEDGLVARSAFFNVVGGADPSYYDERSYGNSIRCVARPVSSSISGGGGGGGGPKGPGH